ncbi:IPT/TIG domain-containing protein [Streptomyces sp. NPDC006923]|uniref:IPT/TIG domain-containing protein n=1 Tax=Streptomyces sp. NPDC006923 TaxID=3155355 RepID=UPI0033EDF3BD
MATPVLNFDQSRSLFPFPFGPLLLVLTPNSGPTTGGNPVQLFGVGLNGTTSVLFGTTPATIIAADPLGLTVTVLAPPHAPGVVPVTATGSRGTSNPVSYIYVGPTPPPTPPTAATIAPATGPTAGGTTFVITGTNLTGATVTVGGVPATVLGVDATGTQLFGVTPAGVAGNAPVVVTTASGTATVPGGFTYTGAAVPPTATTIVPATGPVAGGTAFVITGTNLTGATVTVGGAPATVLGVNAGGTQLFGVTPAGVAGNAAVVVTTPAGAATVPGGFTYTGALLPTAVSIVPATGPVAGGGAFVITGTNLTGATVTVGGVPATVLAIDPSGTQLFGVAPAGVLGNAAVVVTTPAGAATVAGGYTFV